MEFKNVYAESHYIDEGDTPCASYNGVELKESTRLEHFIKPEEMDTTLFDLFNDLPSPLRSSIGFCFEVEHNNHLFEINFYQKGDDDEDCVPIHRIWIPTSNGSCDLFVGDLFKLINLADYGSNDACGLISLTPNQLIDIVMKFVDLDYWALQRRRDVMSDRLGEFV